MSMRASAGRRFGYGVLALGALAGLLIGLLIAWVIAPVKWRDTDPSDLRAAHQRSYVSMVADSYALNGDVALAQERLQQLSPDGVDLTSVAAIVNQAADERLATGDSAGATRIGRLATDTKLAEWATAAGVITEPAKPAQKASLPSWVLVLFGLGVFIVALAAVAGLVLARANKRQAQEPEMPVFDSGLAPLEEPDHETRPRPAGAPTRRPSLEELLGVNEPTAVSARPAETATSASAPRDLSRTQAEEPFGLEQQLAPETPVLVAHETPPPAPAPLAAPGILTEFDVAYRYGDDDFYHSVTIDTPEESFVGQCGIVISDVLGSDDAQQVTAFDVWLFETRNTRTVSRVLLSPWAASNEGMVARLSRKGETLTAAPGLVLTLETASLRLVAEIVNVKYQASEQFRDGIFEQLAMHMRVEQL